MSANNAQISQPPSSPPPTSAGFLAASALSVVLIVSLLIALLEAAGAIKRKMVQRQQAAQRKNRTNSDGNNNNNDETTIVSSSSRCKKCSLSEFTWMRHLRQRISTNDPNSSGMMMRQQTETIPQPPPQVTTSLISGVSDPTNVMMAEALLKSAESSTTWNYTTYNNEQLNRPTVESFWSAPVSQLNQMGPARFYGGRRASSSCPPRRRISTPDWNSGVLLRPVNLRNSNRIPRRSYAGTTPYTSMPLTPGVARLCGSLSDISEAAAADVELDSSSVAQLPRPSLLTVDYPAAQSTAFEARLKRIRLIRHR